LLINDNAAVTQPVMIHFFELNAGFFSENNQFNMHLFFGAPARPFRRGAPFKFIMIFYVQILRRAALL
jgi:hypothetical protein